MSSGEIREPLFVAAWMFEVTPKHREEFERVYGPNGDWVRLFRRDDGYIKTELHRDPHNPGRYITLDFWHSRQQYAEFKQQAESAYQEIDARCELLTENEQLLGEFSDLASLAAAFPALGSSTQVRVPTIRPATDADLAGITQLERSVPLAAHWAEDVYAAVFREVTPTRILLAAEDANHKILGFAVARIVADECELENIVVAPQEVRTGVGSALLKELMNAARARRIRRVFLEVRESNQAARGLYERFEFTQDARRDAYYSAPQESAILYSRPL